MFQILNNFSKIFLKDYSQYQIQAERHLLPAIVRRIAGLHRPFLEFCIYNNANLWNVVGAHMASCESFEVVARKRNYRRMYFQEGLTNRELWRTITHLMKGLKKIKGEAGLETPSESDSESINDLTTIVSTESVDEQETLDGIHSVKSDISHEDISHQDISHDDISHEDISHEDARSISTIVSTTEDLKSPDSPTNHGAVSRYVDHVQLELIKDEITQTVLDTILNDKLSSIKDGQDVSLKNSEQINELEGIILRHIAQSSKKDGTIHSLKAELTNLKSEMGANQSVLNSTRDRFLEEADFFVRKMFGKCYIVWSFSSVK